MKSSWVLIRNWISLYTSMDKMTINFVFYNCSEYIKLNGWFPLTFNIHHPRNNQHIYFDNFKLFVWDILLLLIVLRLNYSNIDELCFMDNCLLVILWIACFVYIYVYIYTHRHILSFAFFLCLVNTIGTCVYVALRQVHAFSICKKWPLKFSFLLSDWLHEKT
jgi:hypothetical protein